MRIDELTSTVTASDTFIIQEPQTRDKRNRKS